MLEETVPELELAVPGQVLDSPPPVIYKQT
jgi:hypothetical protein